MKISRIMDAVADMIKLTDRIERLEIAVADMALAFREDSKTRDRDFLEHERRIQKMENMIEFAEKFTAQRRFENPSE
ncbi:MAG: hypothetical protein ACR2RB_08665 [Gammaproteobacteria bacterium]